MSSIAIRPQSSLRSCALLFFALLTFGITWSVIGGYISFPEQAAATFGEVSGSHPLYVLATWAPGIAGLLLVLAFGGVRGLRAFLSRHFYWRCAPVRWAFIPIGIPVVFMAGSLIKGGPLLAPVPPEGVGAMVALMVMVLFLGPMERSGPMRPRSSSSAWPSRPPMKERSHALHPRDTEGLRRPRKPRIGNRRRPARAPRRPDAGPRSGESAAFTDVMIRKGMYPDVKDKLPFTLGYDMVGIVDAAGSGATRFAPGNRVAELTTIGAYAEHICLPEDRLTRAPDGVSEVHALGMILSAVTPSQRLTRVAKMQAGQSLLIHGAATACRARFMR